MQKFCDTPIRLTPTTFDQRKKTPIDPNPSFSGSFTEIISLCYSHFVNLLWPIFHDIVITLNQPKEAVFNNRKVREDIYVLGSREKETMEGRSLPTRAESQNGAYQRTESRYQNFKGNWMEEMRGSLMVVATVIATLTFQIAINPPGGVWQTDTNSQQGCAPDKICKAGTSVLAFGDSDQKLKYEIFILLCTISFSASQTIILLMISGFPLRNRVVMWVLILIMCTSVFCTAGAYLIAIWMVLNPASRTVVRITRYYILFWVGLIVLLCLVLFCRFVFWLLKQFFRFLCCCW